MAPFGPKLQSNTRLERASPSEIEARKLLSEVWAEAQALTVHYTSAAARVGVPATHFEDLASQGTLRREILQQLRAEFLGSRRGGGAG